MDAAAWSAAAAIAGVVVALVALATLWLSFTKSLIKFGERITKIESHHEANKAASVAAHKSMKDALKEITNDGKSEGEQRAGFDAECRERLTRLETQMEGLAELVKRRG